MEESDLILNKDTLCGFSMEEMSKYKLKNHNDKEKYNSLLEAEHWKVMASSSTGLCSKPFYKEKQKLN
jgi:hypothetical protein